MNEAGEREGAPLRVVVVDDQPTIRLGLRMIVDDEDGLEVVGEAGDGVEALAVVRRTRPDVVLMDVRMPRSSGIDAIRAVVADPALGAVRILVLTTFDDDEHLADALEAGAGGFLLKDVEPVLLLTAIHRVARGDTVLDPTMASRVVRAYLDGGGARRRDARLDLLSPREVEVLRAVAQGRSNLQIGAALHCSEATVKSHVRSMLTKLDLLNRVQLVVFAYEAGLLVPGVSSD
ncbi:DNA-binding response regulator [Serinibacter arcticus]|uniref:DNA-binding response regulator n=1 Tax=Serinibacter arcticus TaxID=1655435 RepID=A0A2U1ZYY9_9MICO|nr:response regulator transcription factor [Serinibacter arcticus]PWD52191.1 DNA-binding response regulator [Serinibacter arcticus]